jgi:hypothetical protein
MASGFKAGVAICYVAVHQEISLSYSLLSSSSAIIAPASGRRSCCCRHRNLIALEAESASTPLLATGSSSSEPLPMSAAPLPPSVPPSVPPVPILAPLAELPTASPQVLSLPAKHIRKAVAAM